MTMLRLNWTNRILIYSLFLVGAAVSLTAFISVRTASHLAEEQFLRRNLSFSLYTSLDVLRSFGGSFTSSASSEGLQTVRALAASNPDLMGISILTESGRPLFSSLDPAMEEALNSSWPRGVGESAAAVVRTSEPRSRTVLYQGRRIQEVLSPVSGQGGVRPIALRYAYGFESLETSTTDLIRRMVAGALLLLLLGSLLSVLLSRRLTRPVQVLAAGARRISDGDHDHRINLATGDELENLAGQFNHMVDSLREQQERMEAANRELTQANNQLRELQAQLLRTERLAALGQLSAGVSHELDNPIGVILGYAGLVLEEAQEGTAIRDYASVISEEAKRCRRIVTGLLDFARPSRGLVQDADLGELVRDQVDHLREQRPFRRVTWSLSLDEGLGPVRTDADALRQVLVNLALNAAQAMEGSGEIAISAKPMRRGGGDGFLVLVADTGPGIPESEAERVFEPFYTTKKRGEGTGLGLSICRKLLDECGGQIRVVPGRGGRVEFWLPSAHGDGVVNAAAEEGTGL